MSSQSFADLGISPAVSAVLNKQGIREPFPIQKLVIGDSLAGKDLLVRSPTGSGKTLAFAAPMADRIEADERRPAALIVAPTRELALQIVEDLRPLAHARALKVTAVYGGAGIAKQAKNARHSHILVATPGRLLDLMGRGDVSLEHVRLLVLDEADRMLDMGFRPDIDRIVGKTRPDRQTLLFSATLDGEVARIADAYTNDAVRHSYSPPGPATKVEHRFVRVSHESKLDALVSELREDRDLALVFVRTKRGADRLVKRLSSRGIEAVAMHGNKSQNQRERSLASFDAGRVDALVATDVAARGIDVDGISHVINFDPPGDSDAYLHRIGRTARAGRSGVGVTFVKGEEAGDVATIARQLNLREQFAATGLEHRNAGHGGSQRTNGGPRRDHRAGGSNGGPKRVHSGSRRRRKPAGRR
ncbi:MAG: DEAD/DEAH box helicase [Solirubrobacterales bacterium]